LVAWKAGDLWRYAPFGDDVTGLIVSAEYNAQTTLSGVLAMLMARVKPMAIKYAMFVNLVATNAEKTTQIRCWWYGEIARIDPAQRNSDPLRAYISVVTESSQRLVSLLTLCIRLSQRLPAPMQQWYNTARPQSTPFMDLEHSPIHRSGK